MTGRLGSGPFTALLSSYLNAVQRYNDLTQTLVHFRNRARACLAIWRQATTAGSDSRTIADIGLRGNQCTHVLIPSLTDSHPDNIRPVSCLVCPMCLSTWSTHVAECCAAEHQPSGFGAWSISLPLAFAGHRAESSLTPLTGRLEAVPLRRSPSPRPSRLAP